MTQRALLILVGGRPTPNLLTVLHLKPDAIVGILSQESANSREWTDTRAYVESRLPGSVLESAVVDSLDLDGVRRACTEALDRHPECDWVFNLTNASKIMFLGAAEVARERGVSAWYLDSAKAQVVTLSGRPPDENLFRLPVAEAFAFHGRTVEPSGLVPTPELIQLTQNWARRPGLAIRFGKQLAVPAPAKGAPVRVKGIRPPYPAVFSDLQRAGLIAGARLVNADEWEFTPLPELRKFVTGEWLELYTWIAAQDAGCFDDIAVSVRVPAEAAVNELDFAGTAHGMLVIAECKTDSNPFDSEKKYLDKLNSIAGMVGGNAVGRLLIVSRQGRDDPQFRSFSAQARERRVVLVTGEDLPNLSAVLRREAGADAHHPPTYGRN